jgi:acetylornithine deacetylase/succinyl-diaminopimelate desuccinylase-like protein
MLSELQQIAGDDIEFEIQRYDPGMLEPDMSQFNTLAEIICQADPLGTPVPLLLSGVTDGRFFNHLGIQTYGFLPMQLPDEFNFTQTIHAADERIPIAALTFGAKAIYQAIQELGNT